VNTRGWKEGAVRPIFQPMSVFPRPVGPRAAIADLFAVFRHSTREQRIAGGLALLITGIIVFEFFIDSRINTAPPPTIIYVDQWSSKRTDAEIMAQQKKDQAARDAARKARQREFQKLEKQLGIE
jgi:hypothetical protein